MPGEGVHASKPFASFVSRLFARPGAEVVDLGPVVGANVTFLGERLGGKIHVEDLYADIGRHVEHDTLDQLPEFLRKRFHLADASIDAVLGWDVFDYLSPPAAKILADELVRILRPGGVLLGFFGSDGADHSRHVKYVIEDETHLRYRLYPSASRRWVLQNRDINLMFAGLELCESVLRTSGVREILFRKRIPA